MRGLRLERLHAPLARTFTMRSEGPSTCWAGSLLFLSAACPPITAARFELCETLGDPAGSCLARLAARRLETFPRSLAACTSDIHEALGNPSGAPRRVPRRSDCLVALPARPASPLLPPPCSRSLLSEGLTGPLRKRQHGSNKGGGGREMQEQGTAGAAQTANDTVVAQEERGPAGEAGGCFGRERVQVLRRGSALGGGGRGRRSSSATMRAGLREMCGMIALSRETTTKIYWVGVGGGPVGRGGRAGQKRGGSERGGPPLSCPALH